MARSVFAEFQDTRIRLEGNDAIEGHTCAVVPKMPVRNIKAIRDGRVGVTGGILNMNMLGWDVEKCQLFRKQQLGTKAQNARYGGKQYALRREESVNVKCMCSLSDCTKERVC